MKKILLALAAIAGLTFNSFAQDAPPRVPRLSVGVEGGRPTGDDGDITLLTYGGSLKFELPVASILNVTLSGGYTYFPYKSNIKTLLNGLRIDKAGESFVPIKAGAKFWANETFYVEGQGGVSISTEPGSNTLIAWSPGIGFDFGSGIDLGIRYEGWTKDGNTLSQAIFRLAYTFGKHDR